jgi:hypothetical protein
VYLHITHLYCQAPQFSEMTSPTEKSFCVIEYAKSNSCTNVQQAFRKRFHTNPPPLASIQIQRWFDNFKNQGCTSKKESSGHPRVSEEAVWQVEATFDRSSRKCVWKRSRELQMPKTTLWLILRARIHIKPYKFTMIHKLEPEDCLKQKNFARPCLFTLTISFHVTSFGGFM